MLARLRKAKENGEGGFTLIELLVVMIIIGILAAIAIPAFLSQKKKAYQSSAKSDARSMALEVEAFLSDRTQTATPAVQAWTIANNGTNAKTVDIVGTTPAGIAGLGNVTSTLSGNVSFSVASVGTYCIKAVNNAEQVWYTPSTQFTTAVPTGLPTGHAACPAAT